MPDVIIHKINGYLAKPYEINDLVNGIKWILNYSEKNNISPIVRNYALKNFDSRIITNEYISLFKTLMQNN